jgi:lipopolysaccharide/colanic/teichoic acid biosynthesis glycosyltransferase
MSSRWIKRVVDLLVAAVVLLLAAVPMLVLALLIRVTMGSPVLFRQQRPGKGKRLFTLRKFRSMNEARGPDGRLLPDGQRLTRLGRFLRKTSLDELPQLWNVLKGEMSLVGPRPLLLRYLPYYTERECLRFTVLPGITGWAQVHGRNHLGWDERLALDVWYVEHWSLALDVRIALSTLLAVFLQKGMMVDVHSNGDLDLDQQRSLPAKELARAPSSSC